MSATHQLHVVRVFIGTAGGGNLLGVFLRPAAIPADQRQAIAADLAFSETIFVDDEGGVAIFTPAVQLPFAGHPLVGTAWLLRREGAQPTALHPPAGEVPVWQEDSRTWIRGRAEWAPQMQLLQLATPADVDALEGAPGEAGFVDAWAWIDPEEGIVRSRVFAPEVGITEDEATGAAAVRLVSSLGRSIEIRQGVGSVILARPGPDGTAEIGGACALEEIRDYRIPP